MGRGYLIFKKTIIVVKVDALNCYFNHKVGQVKIYTKQRTKVLEGDIPLQVIPLSLPCNRDGK